MNDFAELQWLNMPVKKPSETFLTMAKNHQSQLTKPVGSLGKLEWLATQLAAMQQTEKPTIENIAIIVYAADHGIAEEGVSAFPQEVTAEMVKNFANGGAAISVLAKELNADLDVINLGTKVKLEPLAGVTEHHLGPGSANFNKQAAMTEQQLTAAMTIGRQSVERAKKKGAHLFLGGEMGIGNTTSATALIAAISKLSVAELTGPGTGLDRKGVNHKIKIIESALRLHQSAIDSPLTALRYLGGFEIAALTAAYISCAQVGLPILVDGYIASSAALLATQLCPDAAMWMFFSHASAEPGHKYIMQLLKVKPLLDLEMRLGEASGAAVAVPIMRLACLLHKNMATFSQAQVSEKF